MIDSHCHLDATEFDADRMQILQTAFAAGVNHIVNPAVAVSNFADVSCLAHASLKNSGEHSSAKVHYALGIHPVFVNRSQEGDIAVLRAAVQVAMADPQFIGIGEIGLDGFDKSIDPQRQQWFFTEQLKVARDFDLPVIMHVRHALDSVLKALRVFKPKSGIAHAFNGSHQQAQQFIDRNIVLGFGGAMTFTRALQIRRLAVQLPIEAIVLETDAPDISPSWLHPARNGPEQLPSIANCLAELRQCSLAQVQSHSTGNVRRVLARLA